MRKRVPFAGAGLMLLGAAFAASWVQCFAEEDTSVEIVNTCDAAKLNTADPAEATVKIYLETGTQLKDKVRTILDGFRDVCNKMDADLGLPQGGDSHAACNPIADRIAKARAVGVVNGVPVGAFGAPWVKVLLNPSCAGDLAAEAKCRDECAPPAGCDPNKGCSTRIGTCPGKCTGTCTTTGTAVPCEGLCVGSCAAPPPAMAPEAGVPACFANPGFRNCTGKCNAPTFQGRCSTGCSKGFRGQCLGTCTGSCDGTAYPTIDGGPAEAGIPDAGDPDSEAGVPDAGESDAGFITLPGSGNCAGICAGACAGEASGTCGATCAGDFAGGPCMACVGNCNAQGLQCTTTCTGSCTKKAEKCEGLCTECDMPMVEPSRCTGGLACGDGGAGGGGTANPICAAVCKIRGDLAAACGRDPNISVWAQADYKLYDVLLAHSSEFSEFVRQITLIQADLGGVAQRTTGDFASIGVKLDNARKCAESAGPIYEEARGLVNEAIGASLILEGKKF